MKRRKDGLYQQELPRDITGGKRKVVYGKTKADVLRKIADYTEKAESGQTFAAVAAEWWEDAGPKLAANSLKNYKPAYERAVDGLGDWLIRELRPQDVSLFLKKTIRERHMADKTARTQLLVINRICHWAVEHGECNINAARDVEIPKGLDKARRDIASDADIEKVKASYDLPGGPEAYWALYTGMRRGELRALTWDDVDITSRTITVSKSMTSSSAARETVKDTKTQKGTRVLPILDKLLERVEKGEGYVFKNADGGPLSDMQWQRRWVKFRKLSGISCTAHQLRHAFATMLFEAGVSDSDAQDLLGHAQIQTTKDIYTHIRESRRKKVRAGLYSMDLSTQ